MGDNGRGQRRTSAEVSEPLRLSALLPAQLVAGWSILRDDEPVPVSICRWTPLTVT